MVPESLNWTKVDAGIFHHFHPSWISEICRVLNDGILPRDYDAIAEEMTGPWGPDVLTLEATYLVAFLEGPRRWREVLEA